MEFSTSWTHVVWMYCAVSHVLHLHRIDGLNNESTHSDSDTNDSSNRSNHYVSQFSRLMKERNLDLAIPPDNEENKVLVYFSVYSTIIGEINEVSMDLMVNVYFRQLWTDRRLSFEDEIPGLESLQMPEVFFSQVWMPDPFVENGKEEKTHDVTRPNRSFRLYKNGTIFYSQRLTLTVWCAMLLHDFPLDTQQCEIRLMSYRYIVGEVKFLWDLHSPIESSENFNRAPKFDVEKTTYGDCTSNFSTGAYSCLYLKFHLNRQFGYYLIQTYVPTTMIVFLSWVSFFLDPLAVPGRISLGVLTVLTMSTQMASAASSAMPKVSYIKAMDVWLTACMGFLFAGLIEFAVVNSLARSEMRYKAEQKTPQHNNGYDDLSDIISPSKYPVTQTKHHQEIGIPRPAPTRHKSRSSISPLFGGDRKSSRALHVDYMSRICFPVAFAAFNMIYWFFYLLK